MRGGKILHGDLVGEEGGRRSILKKEARNLRTNWLRYSRGGKRSPWGGKESKTIRDVQDWSRVAEGPAENNARSYMKRVLEQYRSGNT